MRHKYHASPIMIDGYRFDSKREGERYLELKTLQEAGEIHHLIIHPVYTLQPSFDGPDGHKIRAINYEADFQYRDAASDQIVIEDVKGMETPLFKMKRKMFLYHYPGYEIKEIR